MSPTIEHVATDRARGQPMANAGRERTGSQESVNSKVKMVEEATGTQDQVLKLITDLIKRIDRLEALHEQYEEEESLKGQASSVFGSSLGQGICITRHATPPPSSPGFSPATYFGMRQREQFEAAKNVEMAQAPQHFVPPLACQPWASMHPMQPPGQPFARVPDTRQRKLNIRPFDGKELYPGQGSGFLSWGKRFMRQIQFAERASGFPWTEDVKVDVLGYYLSGIAEGYYNQQVEVWWEEQPRWSMQCNTYCTPSAPRLRLRRE